MRATPLSFVNERRARGGEVAFAHRPTLRVHRWTYEQPALTARKIARELESRGIRKGDRVLLRARNCPEWAAAFYGCLLRGVIVAPLDAQSSPVFAYRVQRQAEPKLLLSSDKNRDGLDPNLPAIELDDLVQAVASRSSAPYPAGNLSESDIVEIIYASGTTGEPKGGCITHRNLLANIAPLEECVQRYIRWERFVHPIRLLNLLPLSHVFGQLMGLFVPQLPASLAQNFTSCTCRMKARSGPP